MTDAEVLEFIYEEVWPSVGDSTITYPHVREFGEWHLVCRVDVDDPTRSDVEVYETDALIAWGRKVIAAMTSNPELDWFEATDESFPPAVLEDTKRGAR